MNQIQAAIEATKALADAIRELGSVPSGHLYASLMGKLSLEQYQALISIIEKAGLISIDGTHLIRWIGPYPLAPAGMRP